MRQSETFYGMVHTQSVGFFRKSTTKKHQNRQAIHRGVDDPESNIFLNLSGNGELPGKFCLNFDPSIILGRVSQLQWRWTCDMYQGVQELWKLERCNLFCSVMVVCFWRQGALLNINLSVHYAWKGVSDLERGGACVHLLFVIGWSREHT